MFPSALEIAMRPRIVVAGDRFIVTDTMTEEERPHVTWTLDDVWIAVAPTGRAVDGFDEWKMRREVGSRALSTGFPQLSPLMACPSTGGRA